MMQAAGKASTVYLAWITGGLLSFFGALTYAELGAMQPEAGGEYVYMRDAYGPLGGFLYAWTTFLISKPGSIATIATGIVRILGTFKAMAFFVRSEPGHSLTLTGRLVAILLTVVVSAINFTGVRRAGAFQVVFTALKVGLVFAVIVIAFSWHGGSWVNFSTVFSGAKGGLAGYMIALVAALWAYDGWNNLNMVAGEIRRPGRNVPMALIAGVGLVALLYIAVNAAVQYVMPAPLIAASARPASDAVSIVLGTAAASAIAAFMAVQMIATLNGAILSGARIPFAVAADGYFFHFLARIHPRFHTPSAAILLQQSLVVLLLLFGGNFQQLFSLTLFAEWLFYMLTAATVFIFRVRRPGATRPYRTWGYPVVPGVFIAASAVLLYGTFTANIVNSALGILVILAGVPVYFAFARRTGLARIGSR
jgi:APA family basic amino acid/polyamine antiporter